MESSAATTTSSPESNSNVGSSESSWMIFAWVMLGTVTLCCTVVIAFLCVKNSKSNNSPSKDSNKKHEKKNETNPKHGEDNVATEIVFALANKTQGIGGVSGSQGSQESISPQHSPQSGSGMLFGGDSMNMNEMAMQQEIASATATGTARNGMTLGQGERQMTLFSESNNNENISNNSNNGDLGVMTKTNNKMNLEYIADLDFGDVLPTLAPVGMKMNDSTNDVNDDTNGVIKFKNQSPTYMYLSDNGSQSLLSPSEFGLKHSFGYEDNDKSSFEVKLPPNLVLVADLDHTLIGNGPNETVEECNKYIDQFNQLWLNEYAPNNCVLIYATGRARDQFRDGCKEWRTLEPDILIGADGVEMFWFNKNLARSVHQDLEFNDDARNYDFVWKDSSWYGELKSNWNQEFAESLYYEYIEKYSDTMAPIPKGLEFVEEFRISVLVHSEEQAKRAVDFFETRIAEYNNNIKNNEEANNVYMKCHCFYCKEMGDSTWWAALTPEKGGKGAALDSLCRRLHIKDNIKDRLIICGDSGNDISMMLNHRYQIVIVGNSSVKLKSFYDENKNKEQRKNKMLLTKQDRTLGVIEGLKHFSKINNAFMSKIEK